MAFPWLREPWLRLVTSAEAGRLAHAYYLQHNIDGGSTKFIQRLNQFLLCKQPGKSACGKCKSCLLYLSGNHPDTWTIDGAQVNRIGVDTVRELQQNVTQTANQNGLKVAVILEAEKMTEQAGNALLKVLEEPPADTHWLVSTKDAERLLPTLRSRMQWLSIAYPTTVQSDEQLTFAGQLLAGLRGQQEFPLLKDKDGALSWLDVSENLLMDWLLISQRAAATRLRYQQLADELQHISNYEWVNVAQLSEWVSECRQLRQRYQGSTGINLPLLLSFAWSRWSNTLSA
ncbi:MAG: DNA polymerase III subunit delta' [Idiomarinaceae bacterium]|uniref:DNA polymerase III subunit delta' n=1 Tax=Idiomarina sp. 28-8 TaxID=1260624 RepID=UPI0003094088|nr:DNA polymerase III subunit delta' [Idiomarina sp. 28-8]NWO04063.1 DNA polymerase III subunit delta' [Idiomarinaceae bacterium]